MPELPEVETIRLGLERRIIGQVINEIEVRVAALARGDIGEAEGAMVRHVRRRGKVLIIDLDNGRSMLIHLKMTGQLVYRDAHEAIKVVGGHPQAAYNQPLPHTHTHIIIHFKSGGTLYFNDLRKFGWLEVRSTDRVNEHGLVARLGPEPLDNHFSVALLKERLMRYPNRLLFPSLMDQSLVAGIGNIYANESLYVARISPERRVRDITDEEWHRLHDAIIAVLRESLRYGGTSDSTYIGVDGERGDYLKHAHVYHQRLSRPEGLPVEHKKIAGRTAHFVPQIQR